MKKVALIAFVFASIIAMGSCSIDDSNDIEVIKPGDTVIVGKHIKQSPN